MKKNYGELKVPILDSYKQKTIPPTKKEEADFVKNLRPDQKKSQIVRLKEPEELFNSGNWDGRVYYSFWQKIIRRLQGKTGLFD